MAQTFIVKGDIVANPSANNIGRAQFVRITATADVTGTVLDADDVQLGQFYLENGDTVIIEKNQVIKLLVELQTQVQLVHQEVNYDYINYKVG
jgi:hypothetical protein